MKTIAVIVFIILSTGSFAQKDTTFFFGVNGKIGPDNNPISKKAVEVISSRKIRVKTYDLIQSKWTKAFTETYQKTDPDTYSITFNSRANRKITERKYSPLENGGYKFTEEANNKLVRTGYSKTIAPLILDGTVIEFYGNGNKKSESIYKNNELVSNRNWKEDGTEYYDNIFYSVDKEPSFGPGINYLNEHILKTLKDSQVNYSVISGKIIIGFVVFENGSTGGFRVVKGLNQKLDDVLLQSFSSLVGEWTPAKLNGEPVRFFVQFPINFDYKKYNYSDINFDGGIMNWSAN